MLLYKNDCCDFDLQYLEIYFRTSSSAKWTKWSINWWWKMNLLIFFLFGRTWGSEIYTKFSILTRGWRYRKSKLHWRFSGHILYTLRYFKSIDKYFLLYFNKYNLYEVTFSPLRVPSIPQSPFCYK